jgi:hypothetical protein
MQKDKLNKIEVKSNDKKKRTKIFRIPLTKLKHTFSSFNSYIRQTIKPYACSIVLIERLNESIHITKDNAYPI